MAFNFINIGYRILLLRSMKYFTFIIVIVLTACQSSSLNNNQLSSDIKEEFNPAILQLKLVAINYKFHHHNWPDNKDDFQQIYGDSVSNFFNQFKTLDFHISNDTLVVNYQLNKNYRLPTSVIEFIDPNIDSNSVKIQIKSSVVKYENSQNFKTFEEGKLVFMDKLNEFLVTHYYKGGQSINNIIINNR